MRTFPGGQEGGPGEQGRNKTETLQNPSDVPQCQHTLDQVPLGTPRPGPEGHRSGMADGRPRLPSPAWGDRGKSEPALSRGRPWGATGRGRVRRTPAPEVRGQAAWGLSRGPLGVGTGGGLPSSGRQTTSEVLVHTLQSKCRVQTPGTGPSWPPALASRPPAAPSPSPGSDCEQRRRTR